MTYDLECEKCGEEKMVRCKLSEKDNQKCKCGGKMKVVIKSTPTHYGNCGGGFGTVGRRG